MNSKEIERLVEEILIYMNLGEHVPIPRKEFHNPGFMDFGEKNRAKEHAVALYEFSGAEPLFASQSNEGIFTDANPRDVDNCIDVSFVLLPNQKDKHKFSLERFRSVPLSKFRGRPISGTHAVEISLAFIEEDGTYRSLRGEAFWAGKDKKGFGIWNQPCHAAHITMRDSELGDVYAGGWMHPQTDSEVTRTLNLAIGVQFTRYYEWAVIIRFGDGPSVRFATDPQGAKETFKLRDVPPGKQRRAALRNWVMEHWRKSRVSDDMALVRQHLRGETRFTWSGMSCEVIPSQYDINLYKRIMGKKTA